MLIAKQSHSFLDCRISCRGFSQVKTGVYRAMNRVAVTLADKWTDFLLLVFVKDCQKRRKLGMAMSRECVTFASA